MTTLGAIRVLAKLLLPSRSLVTGAAFGVVLQAWGPTPIVIAAMLIVWGADSWENYVRLRTIHEVFNAGRSEMRDLLTSSWRNRSPPE